MEVRLEGNPNSEFVRISIIDDGPGMDEDLVRAIGQPFPQARTPYHATTQTENGAGLGLYIVNRLIALNRGRFDLESTLGQGTTVVTYWPQAVYTISENRA